MSKNRQYPAKEIICALMFSNGDSNYALEECQQFVISTVNSQLKMIINKSRKIAQIRGKNKIGFLDILFIFRRHHLIIKRMFAYIKRIEVIPVLVHAYESTQDSLIDNDFEQSSSNDAEEEFKGKLI